MALRSMFLALACTALAWGQNPAITIAVDAAANRHAISPNVYGMAWADAAALSDLNCPVNMSTSRLSNSSESANINGLILLIGCACFSTTCFT